jgi:tetratricopeptide (TPR) repeat protein
MPQLPFEIPESLASYAEHFEDDPLQATKRLKKQLKKRGPDAVGHFLLAWFYHLKGMDEQAVDEALKARIFAPGSPFFQKLHYYLSHPKAFEAWTPDISISTSKKSSKPSNVPGPVLNLDNLIQKLTAVESKRIQPKDLQETQQKNNDKQTADNVDDIVSETLAKIHEKQGKTDAAIRTYEQLKKLYRQRRDHYNDQITRLQKLKEEDNEE